jgi:2-polyprenyl-3-methyl-5-hydroxy-6-metoxy-1,4-benzoquinol methylase
MKTLSAEQFLRTIPVSAEQTRRWDREWINYFNTEVDPRVYLMDHPRMIPIQETIDRVGTLSDEEMLVTQLFKNMLYLSIWVPGADLVDKAVLEIGCGQGYLGKQLAYVAHHFLGIDYSEFALSIARLVSPPNCVYLHLSQADEMLRHRATIDTMVARYFFIHQNFETARWVLQLAHLLLKPGGRVHADFYQGDPQVEQGIVYPARSKLETEQPSCAYEYSQADVRELAALTGFKVVHEQRHVPMQRLFVRLEKA